MSRTLIALILLLLLATGCAPFRTPVDAPSIETDPLPAASSTFPYSLQVGDRVALRFYNNPELDEEQPIRPDGNISLPLLGQVTAAGRTPADLEAELADRYAGELTVPKVSVVVREFTPQRVFVGGEVRSPGALPLHGPLTLFQAIQEAGGLMTTARPSQVVLIRQGADGDFQGRAVDLSDIRAGRNPQLDVFLAPRDIVFVPRSTISNVNLWVQQYVRDVLPIDLGLFFDLGN